MKLRDVDYGAYDEWKRKIEKLYPTFVNCPDCDGSGEGTCPHCGGDADCETCDGDGEVTLAELLTPELYRRVMMFEKEKLEHWLKGDPIAVSGKGRVIESHNPLNHFLQEYQPHPLVSLSTAPRIILRLPITE
jgi:RecJ-like exonuclease